MQDALQGGKTVPEQPFGGWLKLEAPGEFVVGHVAALKTNENGRYLKMVRRDGASFNFPVPSHLDSNYRVHDLVGEVVVIACVDTQDVGKPSPMRVYKVAEYGDSWPHERGKEDQLDLEAPDNEEELPSGGVGPGKPGAQDSLPV
jgi:hypothetical protein